MNFKAGFSLFELVIVIFIISLVGFLSFSQFKRTTKFLDLNSLRNNLIKEANSTNEIEFFCTNKFQKCFILNNGETLEYGEKIFIGKNIKVYIVDNNNELIHLKKFGRYKDDKINFRYTVYSNSSTSQFIIENNKGIYYMPNYFEQVKKVVDLEEAKSLWIKERYNLHNSDSYY